VRPLAVSASGTWACHLCCARAQRQVQTELAKLFGSSWCCFAARYILHMQIHLIADALGCQRKWYLSRSHLLCRSTTVNRMRVRTKVAIPFNSRGHLGHLFAVKTCLSRKRASTYSIRKHLAPNHLVQYGCRVLLYRGTMAYRSTTINAGSLGAGLQQGLSFICEYHLIAESLGC